MVVGTIGVGAVNDEGQRFSIAAVDDEGQRFLTATLQSIREGFRKDILAEVCCSSIALKIFNPGILDSFDSRSTISSHMMTIKSRKKQKMAANWTSSVRLSRTACAMPRRRALTVGPKT